MTGYPSYAAAGTDFITKRSHLKPGERVVDTRVDAENLPQTGMLFISESTVGKLMAELGIEAMDDTTSETLASLKRLVKTQETELERLRTAAELFQEVLAS